MNFNDFADYSRRRAYRVISPSSTMVPSETLRSGERRRRKVPGVPTQHLPISTKAAGPEGWVHVSF